MKHKIIGFLMLSHSVEQTDFLKKFNRIFLIQFSLLFNAKNS